MTEGVEVVALDNEVAPRRHILWTRKLGREVQRHEVGVERLVALDFVRLPHEAKASAPVARFEQAEQFFAVEMFVFGAHGWRREPAETEPSTEGARTQRALP